MGIGMGVYWARPDRAPSRFTWAPRNLVLHRSLSLLLGTSPANRRSSTKGNSLPLYGCLPADWSGPHLGGLVIGITRHERIVECTGKLSIHGKSARIWEVILYMESLSMCGKSPLYGRSSNHKGIPPIVEVHRVNPSPHYWASREIYRNGKGVYTCIIGVPHY